MTRIRVFDVEDSERMLPLVTFEGPIPSPNAILMMNCSRGYSEGLVINYRYMLFDGNLEEVQVGVQILED
jgi:hypothetical protein